MYILKYLKIWRFDKSMQAPVKAHKYVYISCIFSLYTSRSVGQEEHCGL